MTGREPITLDFTVRVTLDPEAYYAEYGELGRIGDVGPATYTREILTDLLFAGLLPAHQPPILRIEAPGPGADAQPFDAAAAITRGTFAHQMTAAERAALEAGPA